MRSVSTSRCYTLPLQTGTICRMTLETVALLAVFKRKLKSHLFSIAYIALSRVTPAPTNNFFVTYGGL